MLYSVVIAYNQITLFESFNLVHSVVFFILIPNFVGIIEDLIYANKIQLILIEFDKLIEYLESSINITVRIMDFIQKFYKKIILILIVHLIMFIVKLLLPSNIHIKSYTNDVILFASLYKNFAIIHVTLFVDLQGFILKSLNEKLNPMLEANPKDCLIIPNSMNQMLNTLPRIKIIYQKVWIISEIINQRFGCFLLATLVDTVTIIIHSSMGVFIYLHSSDMLLALRK